MRNFLLFGAILAAAPFSVLAAEESDSTLRLLVSSEQAPPGAVTQIKVFCDRPRVITTGGFDLELDPAMFGSVTAVSVFSATGDAVGVARVNGHTLKVQFRSDSGGIGRLPWLPVLTITVPVLDSAAPGSTATVTAGSSNWGMGDAEGNPYAVSMEPGTFTVGGALSVGNAVPGGGLQPAGTVVRIEGAGFEPSTEVAIDGVSVGSVQYVSPSEMDVTITAPAVMDGKRIRARNRDGAEVEYFSALRSEPESGIFPIFSLETYQGAAVSPGGGATRTQGAIAVLNQSSSAVDILYQLVDLGVSPSEIAASRSVTLQAGDSYLTSAGGSRFFNRIVVSASAPVRMVELTIGRGPAPPQDAQASRVTPASAVKLPRAGEPRLQAFNLSWDWQLGDPAPPFPQKLLVISKYQDEIDFTVSATTVSGGSWLSVSPAEGTACDSDHYSSRCANKVPGANTGVIVTVTPLSLPAGQYVGKITLTPVDSKIPPFSVDVYFTVRALGVSRNVVSFQVHAGDRDPAVATIGVTTNGPTIPYSATVNPESASWLSIDPPRGSAPGSLKVAVNPAGLAAGGYLGKITIRGAAGDSVTVAVEVSIIGAPEPITLNFSVPEGGAAPQFPQKLGGWLFDDKQTFSVSTVSGGDWLVVTKDPLPSINASFLVNVNPTGLSAGTYIGAITFTGNVYGPREVRVTLTIWRSPPALSVTPSSLTFSSTLDRPQTLFVSSGDTPVEFTLDLLRSQGGWLRVRPVLYSPTTPTSISVVVEGIWSSPLPGTYQGKIGLTSPGGSVSVPVTLIIPWPSGYQPLVGSVVDAASFTQGKITAGEAITIFGLGLGGSSVADGGPTRVLFDGMPAALLYESAWQINAIVPSTVTGKQDTRLEVEFGGVRSVPIAIPTEP